MLQKPSRRYLLKCALSVSAFLPALDWIASEAQGAELPPLDPADALPKSLGFVSDATKIDVVTHPTFKPGQRCGLCAQYQGKAGDTRGPCIIYAGHSVPAGGWCSVWTQRVV